MKLCVLFPGIGYHCDKPLLYYSAKLARSNGYEVKALKFCGFPEGAKGNDEKMRLAAEHACNQAKEQLEGISFSAYERVVFIGKSIGTSACLAVRQQLDIKADCVLFTPLEATLLYETNNCTAFHGTADPWADTAGITRLCKEKQIPLHIYPNANHSLETGDIHTDIKNLGEVMEIVALIMQR